MQLQDNNIIEFPEKSGIYAIINIINDKHYIGSAINLKIRRRIHTNELKRNDHANSKLQNAWNKYWQYDFIFIILEYCNKEELIKREQWWIDNLKPEYNIAPMAGNQLGYRHTEATKVKLSLIQKIPNPIKGKRVSEALKGRKQTLQHIENMVNGRKGYKHSEETKRKIGKANKISLKGRKHTEETKEKMRLKKGGEWWKTLSNSPIN